ncbi:MAG: galactosylceramidase [Bryobacteraceae bacterium]
MFLRTLLLSCAAAILFALIVLGADKRIVLDGHAGGRVYEGLGAVSAGASSRLLIDYAEPYRSQILDYLFKPGYGAALQHLKVEIGADVNSTDGSEPSHMRSPGDHDYTRGYEWWLMEQAHRRNPNIVLDALAWGAPGWVGGGHLYSPDMANYIADFIQGATRFHNLDIRYTGIWNERPYDPAYVKLLHRTLLTRGISTQIVCCDDYHRDKQFEVIAAMERDPELAASVAAVGVHYPRATAIDQYSTTPQAKAIGKTLWSSEDQPNGGGGPFVSRDWKAGGRILVQVYNRNYLQGAFTNTQIWSPITSYFENLAAPHSGLMYANTPWSGHYEVQGTIWATAHTTQFAQPGWQYMDSACGFLPDQTGTFVALKSPHSREWSVILETISARAPQRLEFRITGGLSNGKVHIWQTNSQKTFVHIADIVPQGNVFTYNFEPDSLYSLTTTTGQGKGSAQPPPEKPFPLPYSESFEDTALNRTPKFLADQDGAFEVHQCEQRTGHCLEQAIRRKPIPWGPLPNPFTMTGDSSWTDYRISAEVLPIDANGVAVMGRIDSADVFRDNKAIWPSGYVLQVERDGAWNLLSTSYKVPVRTVASGHVRLRSGWNQLALAFHRDQITAAISGKQVASVHDSTHKAGMFALGTDWGRAQFDNLTVTREAQ